MTAERKWKPRIREDDLEKLLPAWGVQVSALMAGLELAGYQPILFDGLRTPEEALANAAKGTGIAGSMHLYGCAADVICNTHLWSCAKARCKFYVRLGAIAEALGMVWGGRFTKVDLPHVQGVKIGVQPAMRALGTTAASASTRNALVVAHFARHAKKSQ